MFFNKSKSQGNQNNNYVTAGTVVKQLYKITCSQCKAVSYQDSSKMLKSIYTSTTWFQCPVCNNTVYTDSIKWVERVKSNTQDNQIINTPVCRIAFESDYNDYDGTDKFSIIWLIARIDDNGAFIIDKAYINGHIHYLRIFNKEIPPTNEILNILDNYQKIEKEKTVEANTEHISKKETDVVLL